MPIDCRSAGGRRCGVVRFGARGIDILIAGTACIARIAVGTTHRIELVLRRDGFGGFVFASARLLWCAHCHSSVAGGPLDYRRLKGGQFTSLSKACARNQSCSLP